MDGWQPVLGLVVAWVLILGAGASAGVGVVMAWGRWGAAVPIRGRARAWIERALGPTAAAPGGGVFLVDAAADDGGTSPVVSAPEPEPPEPAPPPAPAAPQAPPVSAAPAPVAVAVAALAPADPSGTGAPRADATTPEAPPLRPARMARADALEELSALLGLSYDHAVAALEAGLWGLDNLEEWTRTMRQTTPPEALPSDVFQRILSASVTELEHKRDGFRVRRQALRGLETLWGVGPAEAAALYDAGFQDLAALRKAPTDKLAKVPGIGVSRAFQIRAAAFGLAPTP